MIFLKLFEPLGNDFVVYYEAAKMFLAGLNPYTGLITRTFPLNYPPIISLFVWPLGIGPISLISPIWNILSVGALLGSIWVVLGWTRRRSWGKYILLIGLFTLPFFPTKFNVGMGQINNFILLFCVLGIRWPFFLALATGMKFAPAVFVLYYLITKDWGRIKKFFLYLAGLQILSFIFVPLDWQIIYWTKVLPLSFTDAVKDWYYNQSLYGFLARSLNSELITKICFYGLAIGMVGITIMRGMREIREMGMPAGKAGETGRRRVLAGVACLYLLVHPMAIQHYFGLAIIPLILLGLNKWTAIAYLLIAANIKQPDLVPKSFNFILSHQFFGVLILWVVAVWGKETIRVIGGIWVIGVTMSYLLTLLCRGKFCF